MCAVLAEPLENIACEGSEFLLVSRQLFFAFSYVDDDATLCLALIGPFQEGSVNVRFQSPTFPGSCFLVPFLAGRGVTYTFEYILIPISDANAMSVHRK